MTRPDEKRRPAKAASQKIHGGESDLILEPDHADEPTTRCRACRHPLRAAKSVERGIGPVCFVAELGGDGNV